MFLKRECIIKRTLVYLKRPLRSNRGKFLKQNIVPLAFRTIPLSLLSSLTTRQSNKTVHYFESTKNAHIYRYRDVCAHT